MSVLLTSHSHYSVIVKPPFSFFPRQVSSVIILLDKGTRVTWPSFQSNNPTDIDRSVLDTLTLRINHRISSIDDLTIFNNPQVRSFQIRHQQYHNHGFFHCGPALRACPCGQCSRRAPSSDTEGKRNLASYGGGVDWFLVDGDTDPGSGIWRTRRDTKLAIHGTHPPSPDDRLLTCCFTRLGHQVLLSQRHSVLHEGYCLPTRHRCRWCHSGRDQVHRSS